MTAGGEYLASAELEFGQLVEKVAQCRAEGATLDVAAFKQLLAHRLHGEMNSTVSRRNHAAIIDWQRRWAYIKLCIAVAAPDIICLQEIDHMADAKAELGKMGCTCSHSHASPHPHLPPRHTPRLNLTAAPSYLKVRLWQGRQGVSAGTRGDERFLRREAK